MKKSTVFDCSLLTIGKNHHAAGNVTAVNNMKEVPFAIRRIYYLYDIPGGSARGGHAHKELHQLIVAASGSFDVILDDGEVKRTIHLAQPYRGLYVPPGLWRELDNFSSGAICLVLASESYRAQDYIRDYDNFLILKGHGS